MRAVLEKKCFVSADTIVISKLEFLRMCLAAVIPAMPLPMITMCFMLRFLQIKNSNIDFDVIHASSIRILHYEINCKLFSYSNFKRKCCSRYAK